MNVMQRKHAFQTGDIFLGILGDDLGPWHVGPLPDLLLAFDALLVGCLQVKGAALLVKLVSVQWLYEGCS